MFLLYTITIMERVPVPTTLEEYFSVISSLSRGCPTTYEDTGLKTLCTPTNFLWIIEEVIDKGLLLFQYHTVSNIS